MTDAFAKELLKWFDGNGRKNLPWQNPRSAYFVWVSEVMLQQTQVATVINYFEKFVTRFATLEALANASLDEVLTYWAGLGYYSRARNLHHCAQIIQQQYHGQFPSDITQLEQLPGIGQSTAGAIIAQAFDQFAVILDGNVKRVLCRYHAIDTPPNNSATQRTLWQFARQHTPQSRLADYTQAIMDLGALICTRSKPKCPQCPLVGSCIAFKTNQISNFPIKKITKSLPEQERFFLLFINQKQEILMERQPPLGIWGSLWSLPTANTLDELSYHLTQKQLANKQDLAILNHRFSHFKLKIKPILIKSNFKKLQIAENSMQQWIALDQIHTLAMPTPITKILNSYMP
jgi:A/G-specific adenine glycosylase